ncbi:MAG: hypothetical protein Q8O89_01735 [Nanoarchaeota archaeon]|nr:hypothetical protein [Nanoarchaeota archaeon]
MKKILILGALPNDKERLKLYNAMTEICKKFGSVSSPIDTKKSKNTYQERHNQAFQKVKEADIIIGEQTTPSTGQGMEIREATILKKPLVVVAKSGSKISGLVMGCPAVKEIIYYDNINDLKLKLKNSLKTLLKIR